MRSPNAEWLLAETSNITLWEIHQHNIIFLHIFFYAMLLCYRCIYLGNDLLERCCLTSIANPIVEIRRSHDRLISTMGFPILVRWHIYIESGPRSCYMMLDICFYRKSQNYTLGTQIWYVLDSNNLCLVIFTQFKSMIFALISTVLSTLCHLILFSLKHKKITSHYLFTIISSDCAAMHFLCFVVMFATLI